MDFWILLLAIAGVAASVEVHFESPDGGFFLKHSPRQPHAPVAELGGPKSRASPGSVLSVDRFTVFQTSQPISVRASYGPFSTKQTVPARYIVPDPIDPLPAQELQNASAALLDLQQTHHLDMSAHIVRSDVPRDSPVLRVLFHTGSDPGGRRQMLLAHHQRVCVLLHAAMGDRTALTAACSPDGEDGVCLAQVTIPASWWPSLPPPDKDGKGQPVVKSPQRLVQVSYSVLEPRGLDGGCIPRVQIQPLTPLGTVPLVPARAAYKELRADDVLTMLVPHQPLFPLSRIHIPVFLQPQPGQNVAVFIVRARVKAGMRVLGATASSDQWNVSVELNPKHTVATVTAFRRDQDSEAAANQPEDKHKVQEIFSWLLEVTDDSAELWDGGRVVWSVRYVLDGVGGHGDAPASQAIHSGHVAHTRAHHGALRDTSLPDEMRRKLSAKLEIQKDDIQAVLPISKNWELLNTAVLTGRQVSQAMKVFIVSQAGQVADVTLQSSCHSQDESVLKVSSSCSSVYVDGSEARGSSNASVTVKYGTYVGRARFTVWMPEFPLEVSVQDFRLSQIKGWRVPEDAVGGTKISRRKRAYEHRGWGGGPVDELGNAVGSDRAACRARFQQSPVDVFARFLAVDQDSGRTSYLVSRRTGLRVTDLVLPLLRVSDPRIANLRGRVLQGRAIGRTEIQVLSPITGRVIGAKEVRVGSDKVSLSRLQVRVVSGLQLNISPDTSVENGYIAETSVTRRLTAQYQEGLLDIDLEFSDGARTPLRDIAVEDYFLLVESLDPEVVAFAPMLASHHPRVIAVGEGNGDLLRVTLLLSEECRPRRGSTVSKERPKAPSPPLGSASAAVEVDFTTAGDIPQRPDTVQNDGGNMGRERKGGRDLADLHDILIEIPLKDENNHEPTVQARQHRTHSGHSNIGSGVTRHHGPHPDMTSLEIGMYVLLAAFCFAIVVFVVSCVVYASKFKPVNQDLPSLGGPMQRPGINKNLPIKLTSTEAKDNRRPRESTMNAHDWVWLGRATLERGTGHNQNNINRAPPTNSDHVNGNIANDNMRITNNPLSLNYCDPDDAIVDNMATSFDNPNHIELPSRGSKVIDSATYCKKDRSQRQDRNSSRSNNPMCSNNEDSCGWALPTANSIPIIEGANQQNNSNPNEEYRPPVPPHRNIGVTARANSNVQRVLPEVVMPPRRHHHHTKHHRNAGVVNRKSQSINNVNPKALIQHVLPMRNNALDQHCNSHGFAFDEQMLNNQLQQKNAFEFDADVVEAQGGGKCVKIDKDEKQEKIIAMDEEQQTDIMLDSGIGLAEVQIRPKQTEDNDSLSNTTDEASLEFVDFCEESQNSSNRSSTGVEVKRATIVGNPMFATSSQSDIGPGESLGLDDLDMDYEQIMHYFDNLKESNA